jgi:preprotein translocase subunit Sec61beta
VLTVGESEAFARQGGMIRFFEEDNRLRFEINPTAAEKVGLRISSKLLKLARIRQG